MIIILLDTATFLCIDHLFVWHILPSTTIIAELDVAWHSGMCLLIRVAAVMPPLMLYAMISPPCPTPQTRTRGKSSTHSATTPTSV